MAGSSMAVKLGEYQALVDEKVKKMQRDDFARRLWAKDYTLWKPTPEEIANRLGWLTSAAEMLKKIPEIESFVTEIRHDDYDQALLLGMGGSSLAPEVFRKTFGVASGFLDLTVLDSTAPSAVKVIADKIDPAKTLFIVSTKSGGTIETLSFFKFFYNLTAQRVGAANAGRHFSAITVDESQLAIIARDYGFRKTFLNDTNIGGRYSALSFFGMVPAALIGADLNRLLSSANEKAETERNTVKGAVDRLSNGIYLGTVLATLAEAGRDKATFFFSDSISSFGAWLEQLIAESLGKEGKGILPIVGEPIAPPDAYSDDLVFIDISINGQGRNEKALSALSAAAHPLVTIDLNDIYELGAQCLTWEIATAAAGHLLGVNPFDQPNVESAKAAARQMIDDYQKTGKLPAEKPLFIEDGIAVFGDVSANELNNVFEAFLADARHGSYVALQAFLQPTPEADAALQNLRMHLTHRFKLPVTFGYGPRYLHSTGQLHKGDAGNGLFIQLTADDLIDCPVPDAAGKETSSISFGTLKAAQAIGDGKALVNAGRRVIRLHFLKDVVTGIKLLTTIDKF